MLEKPIYYVLHFIAMIIIALSIYYMLRLLS